MATTMDEKLRLQLHQAREHYAAGEYAAAEPLLSALTKQGADFADVYNMLGVSLHSLGRFTAAQQAFEAALNLAVTYNDLGKYDQAKAAYERAVAPVKSEPRKLDPFAMGKIANLHAATADAYLGSGMTEEAIAEYRRALQLGPSFSDIRAKLAGALRDLDRKQEALVEYERIRAEAPKFLQARLNLGVLYYSLGRRDAARAEFEAVLAENPDSKSARLYLDLL